MLETLTTRGGGAIYRTTEIWTVIITVGNLSLVIHTTKHGEREREYAGEEEVK